MAIYFFAHQHTEETCPTQNREMMLQLAQHTTQDTAAKFDVRIHGEAVLPGEHRLMMILEAENSDKVRTYIQPFAMVGSVEVTPALTCEQVVVMGCGHPVAEARA